MANYLGPWSQILQNAGGYSPEEARAAALQVLPDVLHYDRTRPATYPNGRVMTDDVYSLRFAWLTNGKVPPDRPEAPRRPALPLPLPRPAQPLTPEPVFSAPTPPGETRRRRGLIAVREMPEGSLALHFMCRPAGYLAGSWS